MTTLSTLTVEHLGDVATEDDLAEFKAMVESLMEKRPDLSEEEAIGLLWGNGDYFANAHRLGLAE